MITQLAFAEQLLKLSNVALTEVEYEVLSFIISGLFDDLDYGHSCSILKDASLSISEQISLLLKSKLAIQYFNVPKQLRAIPISIISIDNTNLVYITKYLQYELDILHKIKYFNNVKSQIKEPINGQLVLDNLKNNYDIPNECQLQAINNCIKYKFSVITGGPGTGKTTTVALLLWLLYQNYGEALRVKISAPTGKASKRVQDSIRGIIDNPSLSNLDFTCVRGLINDKNNFLTIHKLLGYINNSIYFKHNQNNQLNLDVLIIDESSMVSLPLFSKLLGAINEQKISHVILLGDKNQLSSVEEGYVFASMVKATNIKQHVVSLIKSNRSNKDIANLAEFVHLEDIAKIHQLLNNSAHINNYKAKLTDLFDKQLFSNIEYSLSKYFKYIFEADLSKNNDLSQIKELFANFNCQSILCLTNVGVFGTYHLNMQIEKRVKFIIANFYHQNHSRDTDLFFTPMDISQYNNEWYTGRPIIILENDYILELFNGDIGICIVNKDGMADIVFENGRKVIPELLPKYQIAYAITIHKAQGSEYEHVNLVLCDDSGIESMSTLLSKELVYTGITRAKTSISIFAGDKVLNYAITNETLRNTGLNLML